MGWGWFTHLLSLPPCLEVWVTSAAFRMLAHIVITPQRPLRSGEYGHKEGAQKSSFPGGTERLSAALAKGIPCSSTQSLRGRRATFCVVRSLGSHHQQPYGFGNIHQLKNSLIWKRRLFKGQPKIYFLSLWKNGRLSLCARC